MTVASLGLAIDSRPAVAAAANLEKMTGAARVAEAQFATIGREATKAIEGISAASGRASAMLDRHSAAQARAASTAASFAARTGLARHELVNLSRQVTDVAVSLGSGQGIFTTLLQQGSQIGDVFATSQGSFRGFVGQVASGAARLLTPLRLVTGGVAGLGVSALLLQNQFANAQREVSLSLMGMGEGAGFTADKIERIATATSDLADTSVSDMRTFLAQIASTGKVSEDVLRQLAPLKKGIENAFNLDTAGAGKFLAKAFEDPVRGAEQLNAKFMALDATTMNLVQTLTAKGQRDEAQRILLQRLIPDIQRAAEMTNFWARMWSAVSSGAENAMNAAGRAVDRAMGRLAPDEKLAEARIAERQAQEDLRRLEAQRGNPASVRFNSQAQQERLIAVARERAAKATDVRTEAERKLEDVLERNRQKAANEREIEADKIGKQSDPRVRLILEQSSALQKLRAGLGDLRLKGASEELDRATQAEKRYADTLKLVENASRDAFDPIKRRLQEEKLAASERDDRSEGNVKRVAGIRAENAALDELMTAEERAEFKRLAQDRATGGRGGAIDRERQKIGVLGDTARAQDRIRDATLAVQRAEIDGIILTRQQRDEIMQRARLREWEAGVAKDAQFGVSSAADEIRLKLEQINLVAKERNWTEAQYADAVRIANREQGEAARFAEVRKAALRELKELELQAGDTNGLVDRAATSGLNSLSSSLSDIITDTRSAKDAFADLGKTVTRAISDMVVQMLIIRPLAAQLQSVLGAGGGLGALFGSPVASARGNVFDHGSIVPFAAGGVLTRPMAFPMSNGRTGVAGEAGPEGILPLRRNNRGQLGVIAQGGSGQSSAPQYNVQVYQNAPGVEASVSPAPGGGLRLDINKIGDRLVGQAVKKGRRGQGHLAPAFSDPAFNQG